jgi:hypothetical protein
VLPGLIVVEKLRYDENRSGLKEEKSGSSRPQVGGMSGGGRGKPEPIGIGLGKDFRAFCGKNTDTGMRENEPVVVIAAGGR